MPTQRKEPEVSDAIAFWTTHSLDKVFPDSMPPPGGGSEIRLCAARGEVEDAQIAVRVPPDDDAKAASFDLGDLEGPDGARIPGECLEAYWQWYTYVIENPPHNTDPATYLRKAPAFFPDGFLEQRIIRILPGHTQPLWVMVRVPQDARAGLYRGEVCVRILHGKRKTTERRVPVSLEVWPFELPAQGRLRHTEWFWPGLLADYYHLEPWSEEHWQWIERVARDMARHRQDMVLTPFFDFLGCPGLVTVVRRRDGSFSFDFSRLDRWIDTFAREGVNWIEGAHLAGPADPDWESKFAFHRFPVADESGAPIDTSRRAMSDEEFEGVMEALLKACRRHIESRGLGDRYVQHVADEPCETTEESWRAISEAVGRWLPGVPRIDAMLCSGLEGLVELRVPLINTVTEPSTLQPPEELWTYVACHPQGYGPNRFLDYRSIRNRIMFWLCWRFGLKGFLHYGYNYWTVGIPAPATVRISPWTDATAISHYCKGRLELPAGDPFLVYPGEGDICSSIRWEVIRKGIEDFEYLSMLEELAGEAAPGPARSQAEALLERVRTLIAPDALSYTWDDALLLRTRKEIGQAICELMAAR